MHVASSNSFPWSPSKEVQDQGPADEESAIARPVSGGMDAAVASGGVIVERLLQESGEDLRSAADETPRLALLVWPVIAPMSAVRATGVTGMQIWLRAAKGAWSVPPVVAAQVAAVVALINGIVIGAWRTTDVVITRRTLPSGVVDDDACTFDLVEDPSLDPVIGRGIDPTIRTNICMYANLAALLDLGEDGEAR